MFIDIHNHTLFGVDDGPPDRKESEKMLAEAKSQGAEAIILTPHYRRGMFAYPIEEIEKNFIKLKSVGEALGIKLFLGCEYFRDMEIYDQIAGKRRVTMAGSKYILVEFSTQDTFSYIRNFILSSITFQKFYLVRPQQITYLLCQSTL